MKRQKVEVEIPVLVKDTNLMGIPGFIHFIDNKMQHELGMLSGEHFRGIDTPKILEKYSFVRDLMHDYLVQFRNDDMKS